jgi:hypothetical protein
VIIVVYYRDKWVVFHVLVPCFDGDKDKLKTTGDKDKLKTTGDKDKTRNNW